ncbi:ATP-dependent helicase [Pontimonas sp.]|nr:ATP-dependent helicase [Pontimonas sp.]
MTDTPLISVSYKADGRSTKTDQLGMRPMQARAFEHWHSRLLLIKAPPASGKSRALMFLGLQKLSAGLVEKVVVAVPERSIGASFASNDLIRNGFHSNWILTERFDLCASSSPLGKVALVKEFFESQEQLLVCTHSTLRSAFDELGPDSFKSALVAIDEFHHVSNNETSKLGQVTKALIRQESTHLIAMTGSYFRGDAEQILSSEDEQQFESVTFNFYEQLDGYDYLKNLEVSLSFYEFSYLDSIEAHLDEGEKTIVHIPHVMSAESTKEKYLEVDAILDRLGRVQSITKDTGVISVLTKSGRLLKVVDLVNDDPVARSRTIDFLRQSEDPEDFDFIIALGMAKEGFDWPYCQKALTVGYRGSLTELIQIVGRVTRDAPGKTTARFVNLIASPTGTRLEVVEGSNNLFKAIAGSLLMEDLLAPKIGFFPGSRDPHQKDQPEIEIKGMSKPSERVQHLIDRELSEIKAKVFSDPSFEKAAMGGLAPRLIHETLIPKILRELAPDFDDQEISQLGDVLSASLVVRPSQIKEVRGKKFLSFGNSFVGLDELNLDLIRSINPVQELFDVISETLNSDSLRFIKETIRAARISLTEDLADELWPKVNEFVSLFEREPSLDSLDPYESQLAEVLLFQRKKALREKESPNG